ncbi:hypothetical protein OPIT5_26735 [Opitutaceae bacterium TAV5]|nr:hypothetical protein OPIT5_26735 [Opitutaceae bacterium TAV5]
MQVIKICLPFYFRLIENGSFQQMDKLLELRSVGGGNNVAARGQTGFLYFRQVVFRMDIDPFQKIPN